MSSPSGPQQPFPNDPQQQFPPSSGQPGQFPPPSQFPPPQGGGIQPAAPQPAPRRGGGWKKRIVSIVVGLVVLGGIAAVGAYLNRDAANKAKVGDCVAQDGNSDDLKVVECGSSEADFKVVGRVEDKTQAEAGISACGPFVEQGAEQAYWEGERGKKGLVLCLGPVN